MPSETQIELRSALVDSYRALEADGIPALVVGGVAVSYYLDGGPTVDHDVDLFIREPDVERAMAAFERAGFEVTRTHPTWLFKGRRNGATVDVLYRLGRILSLDDEMMNRAHDVRVDGASLKFISREDLAVGQAGAAQPEVPSHWFQAIELLQTDEVDWAYLSRRADVAPDLRAALVYYARHSKIDVPQDALPPC